MLASTKGIGASGFRARPADGALAATGGASPSPRWDGLLGRIGGRRTPRPSIKVRQQLPGRARALRAGLDTVPRPSVHMALAAGRAPHRHNAIPAAGDADRDHIGDAVDGAQRGQAQTAVAGPPPSGAGRTCQRLASRACARRRRRSCRRRSCVPPPGAARQCRAGVVMEHSERVPAVAQQLGVGAAVGPRRRRGR